MPNLANILKNKKVNIEASKFIRKPSIATEDRPSSPTEIDKTNSTQEPLAKSEQYVSNALAKSEHSVSIALAIREHSVSNALATPLAMREQESSNKSTDSVSIALAMREQDWATRLSGKEKELLDLIFNNCQAHGKLESERLTSEYICNALGNISDIRLRNLIHRLIKKNVLSVRDIKNGRGGWRIFCFKQETFKQIHSHKALAIREHSVSKINSIALATPLATPPSSSDLNIILKTTTNLSDEWNFEITPYSRFGFTVSHIKQLAKIGTMLAADVEQSLIEFSYDLDNNTLPQIKTNKLNFLMGLLRSGHSYISEGYRNQQEAIIAEMSRRAEIKRKMLLEERFISWEANLGQEERKVIERNLPTQLMVLNRAHGINNPDVRKFFLSYFIQNQA